jgi:hypothetical protein
MPSIFKLSVTLILLNFAILALAETVFIYPEIEGRKLEAIAQISFDPINESSGIVASRQFEDVYWTHNDSGDEARIFAIRADGSLVKPDWDDDYEGLILNDAVNIDWEDIALDNQGNLIIGACGNNGNARRDLAIYILPEPNPIAVNRARALKRITIAWPDQKDYPPAKEFRNFDCEAVFFAHGAVHFISKHRSDTSCKLYRLNSPTSSDDIEKQPWYFGFHEDRVYQPELLFEFNINENQPEWAGMVTAADCSVDENRLAILNYNSIWIFESADPSNESRESDWFGGRVLWLPIDLNQCEAVCFDGSDNLLISNEQRDIFRLSIADMIEMKRN